MTNQEQTWWKRLHIFWKTFFIFLAIGIVYSLINEGRPIFYFGSSLIVAGVVSMITAIGLASEKKKSENPQGTEDQEDNSPMD